MIVSIGFASAEAIGKQLDEMKAQLDRGDEPSVDFFLDDGSGFPDAGDETLTLHFVDEGDDEFANPSASLHRS